MYVTRSLTNSLVFYSHALLSIDKDSADGGVRTAQTSVRWHDAQHCKQTRQAPGPRRTSHTAASLHRQDTETTTCCSVNAVCRCLVATYVCTKTDLDPDRGTRHRTASLHREDKETLTCYCANCCSKLTQGRQRDAHLLLCELLQQAYTGQTLR